MWDAKNQKKMDRGTGFTSIETPERNGGYSYPLTKGIEAAAESGKRSPVEVREVYFSCCYLRRISLKDTAWS